MSESLYQALVKSRSREPRFAGAPAVFDAVADGENALCGDKTKVFVRQDGMVVRHESAGCAILVASADLMAEAVAGRDAAAVETLRKLFEHTVTTGEMNAALENLNALAGLHEYRSRIGCATLPWAALRDALEGVN